MLRKNSHCIDVSRLVHTLFSRPTKYVYAFYVNIGHVSVSGHYDTLLTTIEGRLEGKRGRGRPRRTWVDGIREWTGSKRCDQVRELQKIETYMGHLQPTAVDATSNE